MEEGEGMWVGVVGLGRSKMTTVPPQGSKRAQCMTVVVPVEEAPLETGSAGTKAQTYNQRVHLFIPSNFPGRVPQPSPGDTARC